MIPPLFETKFAIGSKSSVRRAPGLGRLAVNSVNTNDFPVLTAVMLMFTVLYVVVNFITDLLYVVIDPRIRLN